MGWWFGVVGLSEHTYKHTHSRAHTHTHTHTCARTHTHTHTRTLTHSHTHTHSHTRMLCRSLVGDLLIATTKEACLCYCCLPLSSARLCPAAALLLLLPTFLRQRMRRFTTSTSAWQACSRVIAGAVQRCAVLLARHVCPVACIFPLSTAACLQSVCAAAPPLL